MKTPTVTIAGLISLLKIISDPVIFRFILKNALYDVPIIGKWLFLKSVRKIVPAIQYRDLKFGKGLGGIRPQIVNTKTRVLQMGESRIVGDNIIFNTTPSPGASVCLQNAERDTEQIIEFLGDGFQFDHERFQEDFKSAHKP